MLDRDQCREGMEIAFRAIGDAELSAHLVESAHLWARFESADGCESGRLDDVTLTIRAASEGRVASAAHNDLSGRAIRQLAIKASELMRVTPASGAQIMALPPQSHAEIAAFDGATAALSPVDLAAALAPVLALVRAAGIERARGALEVRTRVQSVASSRGNFGYHPSTEAWLELDLGEGGHGFACASAVRLGDLDLDALARTAVSDALAPGAAPAAPDAPLVLGPQAAAALLRFAAALPAIDAPLAALDVVCDPADPRVLAAPFDRSGAPRGARPWIRAGCVVGEPSVDAAVVTAGATAPSLAVANGAVLVTRLRDLALVDPASALVTGVAEGLWTIEGGSRVRRVPSRRWTATVAGALKRVAAIGEAVRVQASLACEPMAVPALFLDLAGTEESGA